MSLSRLTALALAAAVLVLTPGIAGAQSCVISGPSSFCSATAQLCGPASGSEFQWTGPGIVGAANGQCITVDAGGTYTLRVFDGDNGLWSAPCSLFLTQGAGPVAGIDGPGRVCGDQSIILCGPSGSWNYAWDGPAGMHATTACVQVNVAGTYTLAVTDPATGCVSDPASHDVASGGCVGTSVINCPRPACWWARGCSTAGPQAILPGSQMTAVATCVDDRAMRFAWSDELAGFCRAVRSHPDDLRARAARQFAAVEANVCAGQQSLSDRRGKAIAIDPATALTLAGTSGTIGDWLAATDTRLGLLAARHLKESGVKDAYRDIVRAGWSINHGIGIGTTCNDSPGAVAGEVPLSAWEDGMAAEPLAAELVDDSSLPLAFEGSGPNPFRDATVIAFSLSESSQEDVVIGVYDLTGRLVRELAHAPMTAGHFEVRWDGRDAAGKPLANGTYFVQGRLGGNRLESRLTLMR